MSGVKGIPGMWNIPLSFKGAKEESEEAKEGEEEEGEGEGEEAAAEEGEESQEAAEEAAEEEKEEKEEKEAAGKEESEGKKKAWSEGSFPAEPLTGLQLQSHPFNSVPTEVPAHDSDVSPRAESEFACRAPKACSPSAAWFHVWVQGSCLPWVTQNLHISNGMGEKKCWEWKVNFKLAFKIILETVGGGNGGGFIKYVQ